MHGLPFSVRSTSPPNLALQGTRRKRRAPELCRLELIMTAFWRNLWRTELAVIATLLVFAIGLTVLLLLLGRLFGSGLPILEGTKFVSIFVFGIGILPAVLVFAPIYSFLRAQGRINWLAVIAIGALSGGVLFFSMFIVGLYGVIAGAIVAASTHAVLRPRKDEF